MIDFAPVRNKEITYIQFARQLNIDDLREATHESLDFIIGIVDHLTDEQVVFVPEDPDANDPYAIEGEEHIGWSVAHLIAHVTASSEEGAAISSMLARGVEVKLRPRYETPWRNITTIEQVRQRLEESRRMRLAFLDTWPDTPHLDVYRKVSETFIEKFGEMNAPAAYLFGLIHEYEHHDQIRKVAQQALAVVEGK